MSHNTFALQSHERVKIYNLDTPADTIGQCTHTDTHFSSTPLFNILKVQI